MIGIHDFQDGPQTRQTIGTSLRHYNEERPHSTHADDRTPMEGIRSGEGQPKNLMESTVNPAARLSKGWVRLRGRGITA